MNGRSRLARRLVLSVCEVYDGADAPSGGDRHGASKVVMSMDA
jgi:hypothetical protein